MASLQYSPAFAEFVHHRAYLSQPDKDLAMNVLHKCGWYHTSTVGDDDPNYIDVEWDTKAGRAMLSYTTQSRLLRAGKASFEKGSHRIETRPGRLITTLLADQVIDGHALDVFVQAVNAFGSLSGNSRENIHLIRGDLIGKWYDERMYCECTHHGGLKSCMSPAGYDAHGMFELYKDHAEMVVVLCPSCKYLQARAIVWTDRDTNNKFVDRIYGNAMNIKLVEQWAVENGYYPVYGNQRTQSLPSHRIALNKGERRSLEYVYRLPYLDSLISCYRCNHGYFEGHTTSQCEMHNHTIERPTMEWEHDRPFGPAKSLCDDCGEAMLVAMDEHDDDDHGHRLECPHSEWCDYCYENHCSHRNCRPECPDCGATLTVRGACPNRRYCSVHGNYYCGEGSSCYLSSECSKHDEEYCGDSCPRCETEEEEEEED
jgi:hypothetical protein